MYSCFTYYNACRAPRSNILAECYRPLCKFAMLSLIGIRSGLGLLPELRSRSSGRRQRGRWSSHIGCCCCCGGGPASGLAQILGKKWHQRPSGTRVFGQPSTARGNRPTYRDVNTQTDIYTHTHTHLTVKQFFNTGATHTHTHTRAQTIVTYLAPPCGLRI